MVKLSPSRTYLKTENAKDGDIITFKDEGVWVESSRYTYEDGNPKKEFIILIDFKGEEFSVRLGKFSREELIPAYGDDTSQWVGKQAVIAIENYRSLGKKGFIFSPTRQAVPSADAQPAPATSAELTPQQQANVDEGKGWDSE